MNYPEAKMIGVETLPEKKKGESWKFDESACPEFSKLLFIITDISLFPSLQG